MAVRCLNTPSNSGLGVGAVPTRDLEKSTAPMAAIVAIHRTAEGPSVRFKSNKTPRHPDEAPSKSTPYTRPIGNGERVSAKLTTTPEKKNGTARHSANSVHAPIVLMEGTTTG